MNKKIVTKKMIKMEMIVIKIIANSQVVLRLLNLRIMLSSRYNLDREEELK